MWLSNPIRKATTDEFNYINGTMRDALLKHMDELGQSVRTAQDRTTRATHASVWLGLTPSAPDTKLSETYEWWGMVNEVFDEAAQKAEQEDSLVEKF